MAKIAKRVNWTSASGMDIEAVITVSKAAKEVISWSDGYEIPQGTQITEKMEIAVLVNGKAHSSKSWTPTLVSTIWPLEQRAKLEKMGIYAMVTDTVGCKEEQYNQIMAALAEAKEEVAAQFAAEQPETAKAEEEKTAKAAAKLVAEATEIISQVEYRGEENLLTEAEESQWREVYNNMVNEGGEGYVPERVTKEKYEWAKRILRK